MSALGSRLAEVGTPATHWKCREFCVVMKRMFVNQTMVSPAKISFTNALAKFRPEVGLQVYEPARCCCSVNTQSIIQRKTPLI